MTFEKMFQALQHAHFVAAQVYIASPTAENALVLAKASAAAEGAAYGKVVPFEDHLPMGWRVDGETVVRY